MNEKKNLIEEYEVSPDTMAIIPVQYGSKIYTEIFEYGDSYLSPFKPLDIVKRSCEYFGASYEGRKTGTKRLIGITHKAPIIVDPHTLIFLFPTTSPLNPQCIWISHKHVLYRERNDADSTIVTFQNKQTIVLPISKSSFENQLQRTAQLRTQLAQNIENIGYKQRRKGFFMQTEASERKRNYEIREHGEDL